MRNVPESLTRRTNLLRVLALTGIFMVIEVVVGFLTRSLALMADAGHMMTDVAALSLSAFAMWMAGKPATPEKTYGYHRAEILAAAVNAVILLFLAAWILYEAYGRVLEPPEVPGLPMFLIGLVGLSINIISLKLLVGHSEEGLNLYSAYLEVLGDAVSSVGVILGGAIIWVSGWTLVDPLLSIAIGLFIVWRTWKLLCQAVHVLMEGAPSGLNAREVGQTMAGVLGVKGVHDLHIWTITSGLDALSAHILVSSGVDRDRVLDEVRLLLHDRFGIDHTTLQIVEERSERIVVK